MYSQAASSSKLAIELVSAVDIGSGRDPVSRASLMIAMVEGADTDLDQMTVGERDRRLFELHEWLFGPRLNSTAECERCRETIELDFSTADVRPVPGSHSELAEFRAIARDGFEVHFRVPRVGDLRGLPAEVPHARLVLLERCIVQVRHDGGEADIATLPEAVTNAVIEAMAEGSPEADVQLKLRCPGCGHQWAATFDIVSYLWGAIEEWVQRRLRDVHTIASAYGWSEGDILRLSGFRRRTYLALIEG